MQQLSLREVQLEELNLLKDFDQFCKKYNLIKEKLRILRQIYRYAGEENMTLDKLLKLLDKTVPLKKEKWNREILLAYLFFRDERDKK